jgi:hypothetical protein
MQRRAAVAAACVNGKSDAAHEMVGLVGGDHEQRVVLADAVGGQAVEGRTRGTRIVPTQVSNTARPRPPVTRIGKSPRLRSI